MENKMKLGKRSVLTVVQGRLGRSCRGSDGDIFELHQYFTFRVPHRKGSTRPEGWFHNEWASNDATVQVRWLWTDKLGYFAPELTHRPTKRAGKIVALLHKALDNGRWEGDGDRSNAPEELVDRLQAVVVEYVSDDAPGCWDDYRVLRIPGEPAMVTIARHAS